MFVNTQIYGSRNSVSYHHYQWSLYAIYLFIILFPVFIAQQQLYPLMTITVNEACLHSKAFMKVEVDQAWGIDLGLLVTFIIFSARNIIPITENRDSNPSMPTVVKMLNLAPYSWHLLPNGVWLFKSSTSWGTQLKNPSTPYLIFICCIYFKNKINIHKHAT